MFCSNCGTEVNQGAKFCSNCGAAIDSQSTPTNTQSESSPVNGADSNYKPNNDTKKKGLSIKLLIIVAVVVVLLVGIGLIVRTFGNSNHSSTSDNSEKDYSETTNNASVTDIPQEEIPIQNDIIIETEFYTITLPADWEGRFFSEETNIYTDGRVLSLYDLQSYNDGYGGDLFSIVLLPDWENYNDFVEYQDYKYLGHLDVVRFAGFHIIVLYGMNLQWSDDTMDNYMEMRDDINIILDSFTIRSDVDCTYDPDAPEPTESLSTSIDASTASGILESLGMTEDEFKNDCQPLSATPNSGYKDTWQLRDYPADYVGQSFYLIQLLEIGDKGATADGYFAYLIYYEGLMPPMLIFDYRDDVYSPTISVGDIVVPYMIFTGVQTVNGLDCICFNLISADKRNLN